MILFSGRCLKEEEECEGEIGVGGGICYGDGGCGEGMGWMGRLLIPPIYATKQMDLLVLNSYCITWRNRISIFSVCNKKHNKPATDYYKLCF